MGRQSPTKDRIIIYCEPETYEKFYKLKRELERAGKLRKGNNDEFLKYLLEVAEPELVKLAFRLKRY
ncbi:MAG: hypothetical protein QXU69_04535 [Thermofilaceae archaeon]